MVKINSRWQYEYDSSSNLTISKKKMLKQIPKLFSKIQNYLSILLFFTISLVLFSCNQETNKPHSISGTWISIADNASALTIDSVNMILTIDYSDVGGRKFQSSCSISKNNEIESTILPLGGIFEIDKDGYLTIRPIIQVYQKDIEVIYGDKFRKK